LVLFTKDISGLKELPYSPLVKHSSILKLL